MTENVIRLVRACKRAGADGFYISTQGGEVDRFPGRDYFVKYIKPTDLAVWDAVDDCELNILHVCDYEGPYDDLTPFVDYPGQIVNSSLKAGERELTPGEVSQMFGRPFMGGMDRKGALSTGSVDSVRREAAAVLGQAPERFVLGADCTVLADAPWENLRAAVEVAHQFEK
jgi:uroporphyrinogen decarboxylase